MTWRKELYHGGFIALLRQSNLSPYFQNIFRLNQKLKHKLFDQYKKQLLCSCFLHDQTRETKTMNCPVEKLFYQFFKSNLIF